MIVVSNCRSYQTLHHIWVQKVLMSASSEFENDIGMGMELTCTMKSLQDWQWLTPPVFQFNFFEMTVMVMGT
jgi:hypothetical protein